MVVFVAKMEKGVEITLALGELIPGRTTVPHHANREKNPKIQHKMTLLSSLSIRVFVIFRSIKKAKWPSMQMA